MHLEPLDWIVIGGYVVFALAVGVIYARRAGKDVDQFFLSGRTLPWWLAGTSMIATSFAADTPLLISGWVRQGGIWRNWEWWCYAVGGACVVFFFARWWRRGGVMTKAELIELRYHGDPQASGLRGTLGVMHAGVTNAMVICWVMLAMLKIMEGLFEVDPVITLGLAAVLSLAYALSAGFWGVVVTDLVQFAMAMVGGVVLAVFAWTAVGGGAGVVETVASSPELASGTLRILPATGPGGPWSADFWTSGIATLAVFLGVSWWAVEGIDGATVAVQRIAASKDEREGLLATLWFQVAHYALRPWLWILVGLASLIVFPSKQVVAPVDGRIVQASAQELVIAPTGGGEPVRLALADNDEFAKQGWFARTVDDVESGAAVTAGQLLAQTDDERAYVAMMVRFLPAGLLGLVIASLLAAFMSTIDTHVNLASSYFVNDVYRRFLKPEADEHHYVLVARLASAGVLALGTTLAYFADSVRDLFTFFLAFLSGVGPVYVARWLWWRVRARTEIAAMCTSAAVSTYLSFVFEWPATIFGNAAGVVPGPARVMIVVGASLLVAGTVTLLSPPPDPRDLVRFYRRVRPIGWWGPVRELCPDVQVEREVAPALVGVLSSLLMTYSLILALGLGFLERANEAWIAALCALCGALGVRWSLRRLSAARAAAVPPGGAG
ncbi:MAG: Na+:solute symporter [Planctomycetes bacterium]|nr:Na+:solute symporter [Planctomycetota bacterium]